MWAVGVPYGWPEALGQAGLPSWEAGSYLDGQKKQWGNLQQKSDDPSQQWRMDL